jgi:serine/threonine protein kinase
MSEDEHLPKPGDVVAGKYRIEKIIGKGGMGAVLSAHHELLGQRVAVKFLLGEIAQNEEAVRRFHNEARNAFKIQSEHVCRIMDVGEERGMPFMVMEFLNGQDLSQMIEARGALPVEEAVDYVLQALEAIAQAHAQGIVHRDLKPANLFLAERQDGSTLIKVLDFGIAKASNPFGEGGNHSMTSTKAMLGSPLYMSPEQLRSAKNVDQRADVWALGVIIYELLTATVPFNGETLGELFIAILEQPPIPITARRQDVPGALNDVVMRCMTRSVDQRWQNVAELAEALAPFAPGRSFVSVERVAQALGRPRPNAVGSSDNYRQQSPSYVGGAGQIAPVGPSPFAGTASPHAPAVPTAQMPPQMTGTGGYGPPQPGAPVGSSQTNAIWANSSAGNGPVPTSKAPLFAGLGLAALVVLGLGGVAVFKVTHKTPAATGVPSATESTTSTSPTVTTTSTTPTAATTDTATAPTATGVTTAPTAHGTGTHAATGATRSVKPPPSATATATAATATATATAATATATPHAKKPNGSACATPADCTSGNCSFDPFPPPTAGYGRGGGNVCK